MVDSIAMLCVCVRVCIRRWDIWKWGKRGYDSREAGWEEKSIDVVEKKKFRKSEAMKKNWIRAVTTFVIERTFIASKQHTHFQINETMKLHDYHIMWFSEWTSFCHSQISHFFPIFTFCRLFFSLSYFINEIVNEWVIHEYAGNHSHLQLFTTYANINMKPFIGMGEKKKRSKCVQWACSGPMAMTSHCMKSTLNI